MWKACCAAVPKRIVKSLKRGGGHVIPESGGYWGWWSLGGIDLASPPPPHLPPAAPLSLIASPSRSFGPFSFFYRRFSMWSTNRASCRVLSWSTCDSVFSKIWTFSTVQIVFSVTKDDFKTDEYYANKIVPLEWNYWF